MKTTLPLLGTTLLLSLASATASAAPANVEQPLVQVFLGVAELDDQTASWQDDAGQTVDVNFDSLPVAGLELEYIFGRGFVHWGLNPGGSVAWKEDNTEVAGRLTEQNGSTFLLSVDNSLWLAELHLGAYVRGRLGERVTTYAAAGPMVMYGSLDVDNDNSSDSQNADDNIGNNDSNSTDVNIGYYGRVGIDFALDEKQQLGFSVRYLSSELDFDKTIGNVDIQGPQYVLTLTFQI